MMSLKEYSNPNQACLADYLPWAMMVGPGIIEHKDGALQKTFRFRGADLDSSTAHELMHSAAQLNNALHRLGDGWTLFVEAQRNSSNEYPISTFSQTAAQFIDEERREDFNQPGHYFKNEYFLTLVFKQPDKMSSKSHSWFIANSKHHGQSNDAVETFVKAVQELKGLLTSIFPLFDELTDDETLTYLHSTVSTKRHFIRTPDVPMYLDHILTDQSLEHGLELKLGDDFVKTISIKAFPNESFPGIFDRLNDLDFPFRWVTRFISMGHENGRAHIDKIRTAWYAGRKRITTILQEVATQTESGLGESSSLRKSDDAEQAIQLLDEGLVSFGFFTATVSVWSPDKKIAQECINKVMSTINRLGFSCHVETINSCEAWLSSIPGHLYANVRRPVVHTLNLSHMMPLSAIWAGEEGNTHLQGPSHFVAKCRGNTAFRFSSNVSDVGHTLIFGPTGAGKSTLLSFMAAQWLRYPQAQVFIFDKGSSSRVITEAVGGSFFSVGAKTGQLCFQPLKNIHDQAEQVWAQEWLLEILADQGVGITTDLKNELWQGIMALSEQAPSSRTITVLKSLIQSHEVREALSSLCLGGPYGYLFDSHSETEDGNFWQTFEMAELFEQKHAIKPALSYLFHRLTQRFDGKPTLLILDEAWLYLENTLFAHRIKIWLKELRKANVYVIFATQSLSDAMESPIALALKESCPTKIFLPNAGARDEISAGFYSRMGLNQRQIDIIATASPKREYYVSSPLGNRLFELCLGPVALALCTGNPINDQKLINDVLSQQGREGFLDRFLQIRGVNDENC